MSSATFAARTLREVSDQYDRRGPFVLQSSLRIKLEPPELSEIGHHAKPKRASATAPLRTGADTCSTGADARSSTGAYKEADRRQSNHERTDDQAGRRRLANTDSDGGSP